LSDIFDDASETEQLHRELAIRVAREYKRVPHSGHCLSCNEIVARGRFCNAECREDWELEQKIKRITGR